MVTAIILFPQDKSGLPQVNVYRSDAIDGTYELIDTVNVGQCEYEDPEGDYRNFYRVTFTDGQDESTPVPVRTLFQRIIDIIRVELGVAETALPDSNVDFLIESVKVDIIPDICKYEYGVQLTKESEGVYRIPNRYFFDRNFGGTFSVLDFDLFKQSIPLTVNSPKIPVHPISVDVDERFVVIDEPMASTDVLKMTFYSIGRHVADNTLCKLLAYKIGCTHFDKVYSTCILSAGRRVKIGDVTVENGVKAANVALDMSNKCTAKYRDLVNKIKNGFYRVK